MEVTGISSAVSSFNKLRNKKKSIIKMNQDLMAVYSRNNFPKKAKNVAYVINLDEYADVGTNWIALFCSRIKIGYFDSFGVEHVAEDIKEFVRNKNMIANIFRVEANNSVMCGYFCIGFINFMPADKKLTDFTSMFLR